MTAVRHETNPFQLDVNVDIKKKRVAVHHLRSNKVLVDSLTGEIDGTHVCTYKQVDGTQFVKLFARNIGLIFELNKPGIKVFSLLIEAVQDTAIRRDTVRLNRFTREDFIKANPLVKLCQATFARGLRELENAMIIAKARERGTYYINPNFCFNGDRIAFTTTIERKEGEGQTK